MFFKIHLLKIKCQMFGVIYLIMQEEYSESYPRIIASLSFLTAGIQGRGNLSDAVYKAQTSRPHKLDASKRWLSKLAAQVALLHLLQTCESEVCLRQVYMDEVCQYVLFTKKGCCVCLACPVWTLRPFGLQLLRFQFLFIYKRPLFSFKFSKILLYF